MRRFLAGYHWVPVLNDIWFVVIGTDPGPPKPQKSTLQKSLSLINCISAKYKVSLLSTAEQA